MIRYNIIGRVFWGRGVFSGSEGGLFWGWEEYFVVSPKILCSVLERGSVLTLLHRPCILFLLFMCWMCCFVYFVNLFISVVVFVIPMNYIVGVFCF